MTQEDFKAMCVYPQFDLIVWDKDMAYKVTSYSEKADADGFRTMQVSALIGYSYKTLNKDTCKDFRAMPTGEMLAVFEMVNRQTKDTLRAMVNRF